MWLVFSELVLLLIWIGIKSTVSIFYNGSNQKSYFIHYLYHSFFGFPIVFILMLSVLVIFIIQYKIKDLKTKRAFKFRLITNSLRISRILVLLFLILMCISMGYQIQEDINNYISKQTISETLIITDFKLSDGARISKSILPYQIQSEDDIYYLYKKTKLDRQTTYTIQYFINHSNDKVILGIKEL
ncbi:hypothetical protein D7Z26_10240 [Cohnella endophytica]|uniref:Uncharacterized protein n=1 Tax=Cohnella endophytica TaxID=2419778 RepID=A0A494Y2A2_9BACL|nr:hypothetical protein D7Z26_10240 [Cohnella endophytica]